MKQNGKFFNDVRLIEIVIQNWLVEYKPLYFQYKITLLFDLYLKNSLSKTRSVCSNNTALLEMFRKI